MLYLSVWRSEVESPVTESSISLPAEFKEFIIKFLVDTCIFCDDVAVGFSVMDETSEGSVSVFSRLDTLSLPLFIALITRLSSSATFFCCCSTNNGDPAKRDTPCKSNISYKLLMQPIMLLYGE